MTILHIALKQLQNYKLLVWNVKIKFTIYKKFSIKKKNSIENLETNIKENNIKIMNLTQNIHKNEFEITDINFL